MSSSIASYNFVGSEIPIESEGAPGVVLLLMRAFAAYERTDLLHSRDPYRDVLTKLERVASDVAALTPIKEYLHERSIVFNSQSRPLELQ